MKKLITWLAALIFVLNLFGVNIYADANNDEYLTKSIEALAAFGIITDEPQDIDTEEELSRETAALWLYRALRLENEYETSIFSDVPVGSISTNAVMALNEWQIISGFSDGRFRPADTISYTDYVTMLVKVLNYENAAAYYGGYPVGYIKQADRLKLNKKVLGSASERLTVGDGAKLLYNALKTEMQDMEGIFLEVCMDITMIEGRVTADYKTALTSPEGASAGRIKIDDTVYQSDIYGELWLGKYVNAFWREVDGTDVLVHLENDTDFNEITVNAADFVREKSDRTTLVYEAEEDDEEKIRISPVADIIYNGKAYPDLPDGEFYPECGEIRALDSDDDGVYDVLFITRYDVVFVQNVVSYSKTIYNKFNAGDFAAEIEIGNDTDVEIFDSYGEVLEFSDIGVNNIIFVAQSKTGNTPYCRIVVSDVIKKGLLGSISEDYITIDGTEYPTSKAIEAAVGAGLLPAVNVNREYYFYIDPYGNVAAYETVYTGKQYGYLKRAYTDFDTEKYYLKIFTADSIWKTYEVKEEVTYDGIEYSDAALIANIDVGVMVRYETDSKMRVKSIETPVSTSQSDTGLYDKIKKDVFRKAEISSTLGNNKFYTMNKSFSNTYFAESDVTVFLIPTAKGAPDEDFKCTNMSYFASESRYTADVYDMDEYMFTDLMVIEYDSSDTSALEASIGENDYCLMVDKVMEAYINDELVSYVSGFHKNEQWSYTSSEAGTFKGLKRGDIIRTKYDASGKLKQYIAVHRYGTETLRSNVSDVNNAKYIFGDVLSVEYDKRRMRIDEGKDLTVITPESAYVTVYESGNNEIRAGSLQDIAAGDYVVLRMRTSVPYEIFVYKK